MLRITSEILNAFDVNVTYAQPHSRTTYVNDVKFNGTSDVHTLHGLGHLFGGLSLRLKTPYVNGQAYVRE